MMKILLNPFAMELMQMLVELDLVVIQVKIWMVSLLILKQPNLLYFTAMLSAQVASTTRKTDVCRNIM